MSSRNAASRRQRPKRHAVHRASVIAAALSALFAAGGAIAATSASDASRAASGLAERVASLRQAVTERQASPDPARGWVDRVLSPRIELSQEQKWNKWKNA
jgi:hypothetical protein